MPRARTLTREQSAEARRRLAERAQAGQLALPDALRELRSALGLTQQEFGRMFRLTRRQVSELENDEGNPTAETLGRIGRPFGFVLGFVPKSPGEIVAPEAVVLRSWSRLYNTLRDAAFDIRPPTIIPRNRNPDINLRSAVEILGLTEDDAAALASLQALRNRVAHSVHHKIGRREAERFRETAERLQVRAEEIAKWKNKIGN